MGAVQDHSRKPILRRSRGNVKDLTLASADSTPVFALTSTAVSQYGKKKAIVFWASKGNKMNRRGGYTSSRSDKVGPKTLKKRPRSMKMGSSAVEEVPGFSVAECRIDFRNYSNNACSPATVPSLLLRRFNVHDDDT